MRMARGFRIVDRDLCVDRTLVLYRRKMRGLQLPSLLPSYFTPSIIDGDTFYKEETTMIEAMVMLIGAIIMGYSLERLVSR